MSNWSKFYIVVFSLIALVFILTGCGSVNNYLPATKKEVQEVASALDETRDTLALTAAAALPDSPISQRARTEANASISESIGKLNFFEKNFEAIAGIATMVLFGGAYHKRRTVHLKKLARKAANLPIDQANECLAKNI